MGRYLRYWYTYRNVVAVLIALLVSGSMYWLYTQQVACDAHQTGCIVNTSVHPEDRFYGYGKPDPQVLIVGIDNQSVKALKQYPLPRGVYATALRNLEKDGALVVGFDVSFPDPAAGTGDPELAQALRDATIPVVLSYPASALDNANGKLVQTAGSGVDEIPLKAFRCMDQNADPNIPCQQPIKNVILASPDVQLDGDGVVRRIPLFVQPACFALGTCSTPLINTFAFAAYRAANSGADPSTGSTLQESGDQAIYGSTWTAQVDSTGSALINFSGPPGNYEHGQYVPLIDVLNGAVSADRVKGSVVLIGAYNLSGVHDEQLVTTSAGSNDTLPMAGVELHANVVQMFGVSVGQSLLTREPPFVVFLSVLALAVLLALLVARLSVLRGLFATGVGLVVFTVAMAFLAGNNRFVPDMFHPWLAMGLTYTGVTAYRVLYEDRERRKVTSLFGQYLKPEIVRQLAKTRGGVADIMLGGERRDLTLLFVDVRGFTSMSESMSAHDVTELVQMYLDHLSGIIFTWDGTVDKYVGDEIVAFWNAPRDQPDHALLAVRCAYDLINRAPELQAKLLAKGLPPIRWGIGVNTGPAVVGNLGSRSRIQYTALGDTVNTAARFCANASAFHLLIGQPTYEMCKDYIAVDLVPGVQLKGKSAETFRIYQVVAIRQTPTSPWVQFPTEMAAQAHQTFAQQYTQKAILAAGNAESKDILVGTEAEAALAAQAPPIQPV
ncbi:MAG TPA: adenylate/guanylate cyclase domain-containing protein [Candidatus Dormibacteraeota bacterium]|nr:adenylate/guanylate cyclase domain-containing protein [Candidatus Dormibacteraeota bacterium]